MHIGERPDGMRVVPRAFVGAHRNSPAGGHLMAGRHSAKGRAKEARQRERAKVRAMALGGSGGGDAGRAGSANYSRGAGRTALAEEHPADFSHLSARGARAQRRAVLVRQGKAGFLRRRPKLLAMLAGIAVVFAVIVGVAWHFYSDQVNPPGPPGKQVVVEVPAGSSEAAAANLLAAQHVLGHPLVFRVYLKFHPIANLKAGPYAFRMNEPYGSIVKTFDAGPDPLLDEVRVTITDGTTVNQIAQKVGTISGHSALSFVAALESGQVHSDFLPALTGLGTRSPGQWEGILFPDTYYVATHESDIVLAQQMAARFDQIASSVGLDTGAGGVGLTPYQVITVASILEREAKTPSDMAKVAQVIYNRLKIGMLLQLDSPLQFALAQGGQTVTSEITNSEELLPSPYNTYKVKGLPPGPISAPGETALKAALHPTPGPWLYYVTIDRQGDLAFATSDAQQNSNIQLAIRNGCTPGSC